MGSLDEIGSSILIAVVASWVTVHLSLRSFYSQRWWEKQAEVYSEILQALADMKIANDEWYEEEISQALPEKRSELLNKRWGEAKDRITRVASIGTFVISDAIAGHLRTLQIRMDEIKREVNEGGVILDARASEAQALELAIDAIKRDAAKDLRRDSWWKWT